MDVSAKMMYLMTGRVVDFDVKKSAKISDKQQNF